MSGYRFQTLPGLARAFRDWASKARPVSLPNVPGANAAERRLLGALGGIAASVAGPDHVQTWPVGLRDWATTAPRPPEELVDGVRTALANRTDPLAALYDASISSANRRRLGTVFTPPELVDHMVSLAGAETSEADPACIIDPGAGVGAFTIAAARRWPGADVIAVDVNPVTLGLLGCRIAFEKDAYPETARSLNRIELMLADYLDALRSRFASDAPGPVLVLGNPPYTRIQELPPAYRTRAAELANGVLDNGHANLAVMFQAATLRFMRSQDVSCMVLPGSFAFTRASQGLRQALWGSIRRVQVQRVPATSRAFAGRSVQAVVLLVGRERQRRGALELARLEIRGETLEVTASGKLSRTDDEPANWFWSPPPSVDESSLRLSDIAIVRRGVATGANDVFFLSDREAETLPSAVRVAGVRSLRGFDGAELVERGDPCLGGDSGQQWLLVIPPDYELEGALKEYVSRHEEEVSERHLLSRRQPWYSLVDLPRPHILVSPLSKGPFKVVLNSAAAVPSNNLLGISLRNGGDPAVLAEWLRSDAGQQEMRRLSRRYHGGSHKLEPGDLCAVCVPDRLQP